MYFFLFVLEKSNRCIARVTEEITLIAVKELGYLLTFSFPAVVNSSWPR